MPVYEFKDNHCGHVWEEVLKIVDIDKPLNEKCPQCAWTKEIVRLINSQAPCDPTKLMGFANKRLDTNFRSRMKEIKKTHPQSTIRIR